MAMNLPVEYSSLTWQERKAVRSRYVFDQQGLCYSCGESLRWDPPTEVTDREIDWSLFPSGFLDWPIHLHHDHESDETLGAVHAHCNAVLWQYEGI